MTQGSGNTVVEQLPAPAIAPAAPGQSAQGALVVTPRMMSRQDVAALQSRGAELSRQIRSATERRQETRNAMRSATGSDRAGLEQRLAVLDARIVRLEREIDENSQQLASIPARLATSSQQPQNITTSPNFNRTVDRMVPIAIVFTIFVLAPIAMSLARFFWKKGTAPRGPAIASPENNQRLERMEQALDSIAIEIERVSEGQRFVTRLMAEGRSVVPEGQRPAAQLPLSVGEPGALPRY